MLQHYSALCFRPFIDKNLGVSLTYRTDGSVSNIRRLQAKTKVSETIINDFLFADDCALNTTSESSMQQTVNQFSSACDNFGLTISTKKTEVLHQPAPGNSIIEAPDKSENDLSPEYAESREGNDKSVGDSKP